MNFLFTKRVKVVRLLALRVEVRIMRVLLVEDDRTTARGIALMLKQAGMVAEEHLQLPARDTKVSDKNAEKDREFVERGRALRESRG